MFGISGKLMLVMAVAMAVIVGLAYWYYKDSQARIQVLIENNATLSASVKIIEGENEKMKANFIRQQELQQKMTKRFHEIEKNLGGLEETLRKHDLRFLALKKPNLIEKRINDATKRVFDMIEKETE